MVQVALKKAVALADAIGEMILREESGAGCELRLANVLHCPEQHALLKCVDAHGTEA